MGSILQSFSRRGEIEHPHLLHIYPFSPTSALPSPELCLRLALSLLSPFPTQMACQKRPSGHLVSVLSRSEASFVASLVKNSVNTYSYVWMGLHDPTEVCTHFSS